MMAKRGKPAHVWSDNGTNFVGAEKDIREAIERWNKEHIKDRCYRKMECNGSLIHQRHHTLVVYGSVLSGRRKPHLKQSPVNSVWTMKSCWPLWRMQNLSSAVDRWQAWVVILKI